MADIQNIIRQLAKPDGEAGIIICTVDSVDKKARTIDCSPINEAAPLLGVNLQANQESDFGLCIFPEVGAFVAVGFINDSTTGIMLATDKIESAQIVIGNSSAIIDADGLRFDTDQSSAHFNKNHIVFNGGKLNGLPIIDDLTRRLNIIENDINSLKSVFSSKWTPTPQDGGAALKIAASSWAAKALTPTKSSDYENTKIKQ